MDRWLTYLYITCLSFWRYFYEERKMIANKFKPDMQSQISHELRIPLSAILGLVTSLQDTHLTDEQIDYIQDIETSAFRLLDAQRKIKKIVKTSMLNK